MVVISWIQQQLADERMRRFLLLGAIAFSLHGIVDPVLTYIVVNVTQTGVEANPFLATYLADGALSFTLVHIPLYLAFFIFLVAFALLLERADEADRAATYRLTTVIWLCIIAWGVLLVLNHLRVLSGV